MKRNDQACQECFRKMAKGGFLGPKADAAFAYDEYIGLILRCHGKTLVPPLFELEIIIWEVMAYECMNGWIA